LCFAIFEVRFENRCLVMIKDSSSRLADDRQFDEARMRLLAAGPARWSNTRRGPIGACNMPRELQSLFRAGCTRVRDLAQSRERDRGAKPA
jgi:hypothetical protein